jgi:hypothetical protein
MEPKPLAYYTMVFAQIIIGFDVKFEHLIYEQNNENEENNL